MDDFILIKILPSRWTVLDNMLQLYAHELNEFFDYSINMDDSGRYRIKSAEKHMTSGWGYFIISCDEYAGFILLNIETIEKEGVFIY